MRNQEYALAVPLQELYAQASQTEPPCRIGDRTADPPACAVQQVEETVCPCIRGEACVCRALAEEVARRIADFSGDEPEPDRIREGVQ